MLKRWVGIPNPTTFICIQCFSPKSHAKRNGNTPRSGCQCRSQQHQDEYKICVKFQNMSRRIDLHARDYDSQCVDRINRLVYTWRVSSSVGQDKVLDTEETNKLLQRTLALFFLSLLLLSSSLDPCTFASTSRATATMNLARTLPMSQTTTSMAIARKKKRIEDMEGKGDKEEEKENENELSCDNEPPATIKFQKILSVLSPQTQSYNTITMPKLFSPISRAASPSNMFDRWDT